MNIVGTAPSAVTITHNAPSTLTSHSIARAISRCSVSGLNTMSESTNHSQSASGVLSRNSMTSRLRALARFAPASIAT